MKTARGPSGQILGPALNSLARIVALSWLLSTPVSAQQSEIERALSQIPEVTFEALNPPEGFAASFELRVRQPVDHTHPEGGTFLQRVFLNYRGLDRPTILVTNGYARADNRGSEIGYYLQANEVSVEHRYFGVSIPDTADWSYLNLQQATADLHAIRVLIGRLLPGPWVSSGRSKGGMTTIAYQFFFPNDVSASVAYVAPLQTSLEDERIYAYLRSAGSRECRERQEEFQRWALAERDEVLPRMHWYAKGRGWTFDYLGLEAALEYAVLEYPFSFWQNGFECSSIPRVDGEGAPVSVDEGLEYLERVVGFSLYSDQGIEQFGPHYYQAATQTGYYGFETEPFADLLEAVPPEPHAAFVPYGLQTTYDPSVLVQITEWVSSDAKNLIYLYGELDTWTSAAVEISPESNSLKFILPDRHHGDTTIGNLSPENRELMRSALEDWLGIKLDRATWSGG
jgi:hypothetical protein